MTGIQETEGQDHAKHGTIDRLTISKIIYRTALAGQLQYVSIALPLTQSSQGAMERQFVVAAGIPLDDKLLQKVCALEAPALGQGLLFCGVVCACSTTSLHLTIQVAECWNFWRTRNRGQHRLGWLKCIVQTWCLRPAN